MRSDQTVMRAELLEATDEEIEDAVRFADPMTLRGLLYHLTGDASIAATSVTEVAPPVPATVADTADVGLIRSKAVEFLREYRDSGAGPINPGPVEGLPRSLALAAGVEQLVDEDLEIWFEELALDPYERGLRWEHSRRSGAVAGVLGRRDRCRDGRVERGGPAKARRHRLHRHREELRCRRDVVREPLSRGARGFTEPCLHAHLRCGLRLAYPYCIRGREPALLQLGRRRVRCARSHRLRHRGHVAELGRGRRSTWEVIAKGREGQRVWRPNVVISAVGLLSRPSLPRIEGMATSQGPSFHTARWPEGLDLTGKRVAVIGTGCSGVQLVPELALRPGTWTCSSGARSGSSTDKGYLAPYPPQVTWLDRNLPLLHKLHAVPDQLADRARTSPGPLREIDPTFDDPHAPQRRQQAVPRRAHRVHRAEVREPARPDREDDPAIPPVSQRPVQVDSDYCYYDALLRDNVTLVTDGIERITRTGIRTRMGPSTEVDVIVYATGFKANECLWPMEVRGRDGRSVEELWAKDGPRAYIGRDGARDFPTSS